jgi:hypothetical protein
MLLFQHTHTHDWCWVCVVHILFWFYCTLLPSCVPCIWLWNSYLFVLYIGPDISVYRFHDFLIYSSLLCVLNIFLDYLWYLVNMLVIEHTSFPEYANRAHFLFYCCFWTPLSTFTRLFLFSTSWNTRRCPGLKS